jgi:hypothetical protein
VATVAVGNACAPNTSRACDAAEVVAFVRARDFLPEPAAVVSVTNVQVASRTRRAHVDAMSDAACCAVGRQVVTEANECVVAGIRDCMRLLRKR